MAAIRSDNKLFTWGNASSGKLGTGNTTNQSSPVQIGSSSWAFVNAGLNNTGAIRSDGRLFTWGSGASDVNGDGSGLSRSSPVLTGGASFSNTIWTWVSIGSYQAAGIIAGKLWAWGDNPFGTGVFYSVPTQLGTKS